MSVGNTNKGPVPLIGLEIHAQLSTQSKLFCPCSADYFSAAPNSLTCPVCLGYPGTLPSLNRRAVELALRVALALGADVKPTFAFDRKHYFYPDLPKGYQITQARRPLALGGRLTFHGEHGQRTVNVRELHLEEDAGKLIHRPGCTLVDLNRAGVALLEIVTEPELRSPGEAKECLRALRTLLRHLRVSSGDMEKGALRCDANVSLSAGGATLGTKTEIKNMNSTRAVERALSAEAARQRELLSRGERVEEETYGWDEDRGTVVLQRTKQQAAQYRYFPEPDLPPVRLSPEFLQKVKREMPELPWVRRERWRREWGLGDREADSLLSDPERAEYFERVVAGGVSPPRAANWILTELLRLWTDGGAPVPAGAMADLINAVETGEISRTKGKQLLERAATTDADLTQLLSGDEVKKIVDRETLAKLAQEAIEAKLQAAEDYRSGRTQALGVLVGQAMKRSHGRADAAQLAELLRELLDSPSSPEA